MRICGLARRHTNSVGGAMRGKVNAFFAGMMFGAVIMVVLLMRITNNAQQPIRYLITECEQSLPRDQQCELFAQPIEDMGR